MLALRRVAWIFLCVWILACDCNPLRSAPPTAPISFFPSCPTCQHAQFVISQMTIPESNAMAMQLGCDINSDGEIDNQLGKVLGAFKAVSQNIDIQVAMNAAFRRGD